MMICEGFRSNEHCCFSFGSSCYFKTSHFLSSIDSESCWSWIPEAAPTGHLNTSKALSCRFFSLRQLNRRIQWIDWGSETSAVLVDWNKIQYILLRRVATSHFLSASHSESCWSGFPRLLVQDLSSSGLNTSSKSCLISFLYLRSKLLENNIS